MEDFGLFDEGLRVPTVQEIRDDYQAEMREEYGPNVPVGDGDFLGHSIGIWSERLGQCYELLEKIHGAIDPDAANGDDLEAVSLITGTFRSDAAPSSTILTLVGDEGTVVSGSALAATEGAGDRFETDSDDDATFILLDDWDASAVYSPGDRVTNSSRAYHCVTGGTSASSGGPITAPSGGADIVDGTVHWKYLGEGVAAVDVDASSVDVGPIIGLAFTITSIATSSAGWNSVTNLHDAELGNLEMTDEELRILRDQELQQAGSSSPDAIRAALLNVPGVTNVRVFYNPTDATDGDGLPPHSVNALVQGGDDQDIWDCLWNNIAAGIDRIGAQVGTTIDSAGRPQTQKFDRPTPKLIWVIVNATVDVPNYDGDDVVSTNILTWGQARDPGQDSVAAAISAQAFKVDGMIDTTVLVGLTDPPTTSTTVAIGPRELAVYDSSRLAVNSTPGTP